MSLLFERALGAFSWNDARHLRIDREEMERGNGIKTSATASLGELPRLISNRRDALADPDREGWLRVSLHGESSAELAGEYVVYEDHPVRGDIFVYLDAATGDPEPIDCADAGGTALGRRLRFWLPEFEPDERPSYAPDGPSTRVPPANPISEADRETYFDRLEQFIEEERRDERERNRERARHHTPRELSGRGESAIPELTGFARTADGAYQFRAVTDDTRGNVRNRFRVFEGDEVLLCAPGEDAPTDFPIPATVERVAGYSVDLRPAGAIDDPDSADGPSGLDDPDSTDGSNGLDDPDGAAAFLESAADVGLSPLLNPVSYDRESEAVRAIREDDRRRSLVVGAREARFAGDAARNTTQRDRELDDAQAFAATCALYADDVCCVHGPPGTGKTRTLVEIVRRAVADDRRVLVCADSNQGVDNALVGSSTRARADEASLHYYAAVEDEFTLDRHREDHSDYELVREAYADVPGRPDVVASTNNSAADFADDSFDLAVVDEATQATTQSALIPFSKAGTIVLAGDHKQLPRSARRRTPRETSATARCSNTSTPTTGSTETRSACNSPRSTGCTPTSPRSPTGRSTAGDWRTGGRSNRSPTCRP